MSLHFKDLGCIHDTKFVNQHNLSSWARTKVIVNMTYKGKIKCVGDYTIDIVTYLKLAMWLRQSLQL